MGKRAVILYRMSTDRQDLETQKRMNRNFCRDNGFEIVDEFYEDGVSGYKNPLANRPDLLNILDKAERKEFDILVVYIFDRIVRREEEYPLILSHFEKHNVEVYSSSTKDKVRNKEHTDKLQNYITGWQNEYESIKTSVRVKDAIRSKNETGKYMGGVPPYGYEIYSTGEVNSKNKVMHDMRINEDEAEVVRLVYDLYNNHNCGTHIITNKLNELGYKNRSGKPHRSNTVARILKNPIYIGRRAFNKYTATRDTIIVNDKSDWQYQPYNENLRIISDEDFQKANSTLAKRVDKSEPRVRNSKHLYSGLVYCGYCGHKLITDSNNKKHKRVDGDISIIKSSAFRCRNKKEGRTKEEHEQTTFGTVKYETAITEVVYNFMQSIDKDSFFEVINQHRDSGIVDVRKQIVRLEKSTSDLSKLIQKLELQFDDAIMNDDNVKVDLLSKRIRSNEDLVIEQREEIKKLQEQLGSNMEENMKLIETYNELGDWLGKFESVDMGAKKAMLLRIIDKIYLYKYDIKVIFKFELQHGVLSPIPNGFEYKTPYHDETGKYVYITMSQPIKA